eukprot:1159041-Pelagomonas_calceolata.AAC.4
MHHQLNGGDAHPPRECECHETKIVARSRPPYGLQAALRRPKPISFVQKDYLLGKRMGDGTALATEHPCKSRHSDQEDLVGLLFTIPCAHMPGPPKLHASTLSCGARPVQHAILPAYL